MVVFCWKKGEGEEGLIIRGDPVSKSILAGVGCGGDGDDGGGGCAPLPAILKLFSYASVWYPILMLLLLLYPDDVPGIGATPAGKGVGIGVIPG